MIKTMVMIQVLQGPCPFMLTVTWQFSSMSWWYSPSRVTLLGYSNHVQLPIKFRFKDKDNVIGTYLFRHMICK